SYGQLKRGVKARDAKESDQNKNRGLLTGDHSRKAHRSSPSTRAAGWNKHFTLILLLFSGVGPFRFLTFLLALGHLDLRAVRQRIVSFHHNRLAAFQSGRNFHFL